MLIAGGVNLESHADRDGDADTASQHVSRTTSHEMMSEDDDMPSGLLGSWLLI